ncbi:MAG: carboxylesterase [Leifsonia xyli]|nr:MAG: carboxylesterase [Leifsonia xyli]
MSDPDAARFAPPCGPIRGWLDGQVVRATGIPYARARRFALPDAVPDHAEELAATAWSPASPQPPAPSLEKLLGAAAIGEQTMDEDCQNLSVTVPLGTAPDAALPVMVWVHGGSYVTGAGDAPIHDPARLVAEQKVVVVAVTYRLGLLGFLGSAEGRPANLGLHDLRAAFAWVHRNIRAFGGDPARVTAFGESAGGDAIAQLMASPDAASLFSRAIIQSAPLGITRGRAAMSAAMVEAATGLDAETPLDELVARQPAVAAAGAGHGLLSAMPFGPQYGLDPLPTEHRVDAAWDAAAGIPVLIGNNANEARMFLPELPGIGAAIRIPGIGRLVRWAVDRALTRRIYGEPALRFAARHAAAGGEAWNYVIDWHAPGNGYRAAHTVDLPLLLGTEASIADSQLLRGASWASLHEAGRGVRQAWADFARGTLADQGELPGVLRWRRADRAVS